jgi:hypothetical protein
LLHKSSCTSVAVQVDFSLLLSVRDYRFAHDVDDLTGHCRPSNLNGCIGVYGADPCGSMVETCVGLK